MLKPKTKSCSKCGTVKPYGSFSYDKAHKTGRRVWCRECDRSYMREHYARNAERRRAYSRQYYKDHLEASRMYAREYGRKRMYGITGDTYEWLLEQQGGLCPICGEVPATPSVDHDHDTGRVRGILCRKCNSAIGLLHDDPERIKRALEYLKGVELA